MNYQVKYDYNQFLQEKLEKYAENLRDLLVDLNKSDDNNKYFGRKSSGSQIDGGVVTRAAKQKNTDDKQDETVTISGNHSEVKEEVKQKLPRNKRRRKGGRK